MRCSALLIRLVPLFVSLAGASAAQPSSSSESGFGRDAPPDSVFIYTVPDTILPPVIVSGQRIEVARDAQTLILGQERIRDRAEPSVAALGSLLPSTQVNVNSRGEALFMVRGASERHFRVHFEGIPLTVPWDERADLSLLPTSAVGSVSFLRGVGSVFDGLNALGGVLTLHSREMEHPGRRQMLACEIGEAQAFRGQLLYEQRNDAWRLLTALAYRDRAGWLLPSGEEAPFNQSSHRLRTSSDLRQSSILMRAARDWGPTGSLRLSLMGFDGDKGVPPETHVSDARFWRYPNQRRLLLGLSGEWSPAESMLWRCSANLSTDYFRQEIRPFDDAAYDSPALLPGAPYETNRDNTHYARLRVTRAWLEGPLVTLATVLRHTRHRESLEYGGPEAHYVQRLLSILGEVDLPVQSGWNLKLGAGLEHADAPESGDKAEQDPQAAPVMLLRVGKVASPDLQIHGALSRRSRFPSLRELYSGALGKFVPNPDLEPERQDLLELGASWSAGKRALSVTGFASRLHGGIEKIPYEGEEGQFQRVNVEEIRSLGLELLGSWHPAAGLKLSAQHSLLHARRREEGSFDAPAEDRADYVSALNLSWTHLAGWRLNLEGSLIGPRHSADVTDTEDGLSRLPAQGVLNLRLAYLRPFSRRFLSDAEIYLRVDNLFDQSVDSQRGLPGSGRAVALGLRLIDAY